MPITNKMHYFGT